MSPRSGWVPVDTDVGTATIDICYLAFLFIGVLEAGPPLSRSPIDLTLFFGGVVGVAVIGSVLRRKTIRLSRGSIIAQALLFGLLAWLALSLFWAPASSTGLRRVFKSIIGLSIAFGYPLWMIGYNRARITQLLWMIAGFGVFLALLFLSRDQFPAMVPNRIALARPIGLAAVVLTVRAATAQKRAAVVWFAVVLVLFLALFKNGSRAPAGGALIACGVVGVWALVARWPSLLSKQYRWLYGATAAVTLRAVPVVLFQLESLTTVARFTNLLQGGSASFTYRLHYYAWSMDSWLSSPLSAIIGQGVGAFAANYSGPASAATYPHNIFVELAISGGAVALLLFLALLLVAFHGIFNQNLITQEYHIIIFGVVLYMVVNSQFTGNLYINKYLFSSMGLLILSGAAAPHIRDSISYK